MILKLLILLLEYVIESFIFWWKWQVFIFNREKCFAKCNVFIGNIFVTHKSISYSCDVQLHQFSRVIKVDNLNVLKKALGQMCIGDTVQDLIERCNNVTFRKLVLPEGVERFVTRIERPTFVCIPENLIRLLLLIIYIYMLAWYLNGMKI